MIDWDGERLTITAQSNSQKEQFSKLFEALKADPRLELCFVESRRAYLSLELRAYLDAPTPAPAT